VLSGITRRVAMRFEMRDGIIEGKRTRSQASYSWNVLRAPVINMSVTSKASYFSYA